MKDNRGRHFIAHHDVRSAVVTATASLTTGTASSLIAGDAADFMDIVEVTLSNNSTVAASVTLVNDGTTARTFQVPASNTLSIKYDVPVKQNAKNTPWLADMEDVTGTTVVVDAVLIKKTI